MRLKATALRSTGTGSWYRLHGDDSGGGHFVGRRRLGHFRGDVTTFDDHHSVEFAEVVLDVDGRVTGQVRTEVGQLVALGHFEDIETGVEGRVALFRFVLCGEATWSSGCRWETKND